MADNSIGSIFSELLQFGLAYYRVFLSVLITFFIGFGFVFLLSRFIEKLFTDYTNRHIGILIRKVVWYLGSALIIVIALSQIGYNITTLIGAAGVFGIAIGLASQTSLSNIISGIFLLSEVAFKHNDILEVGDIKGRVDSIDLMSIKLRTVDNRLVRVPNEHLIKTIFVNESFYTTRRFDCVVMLHNTVNISHAISVIDGVVKNNNYALKQPESYIALEKVEEKGLRLIVGVWAQQDNYIALKKSLLQQIKERFETENIPFSYPTLEVSLNSMSDVQPNSPR
jgi:small-conductance mechanosensitive channel